MEPEPRNYKMDPESSNFKLMESKVNSTRQFTSFTPIPLTTFSTLYSVQYLLKLSTTIFEDKDIQYYLLVYLKCTRSWQLK